MWRNRAWDCGGRVYGGGCELDVTEEGKKNQRERERGEHF